MTDFDEPISSMASGRRVIALVLLNLMFCFLFPDWNIWFDYKLVEFANQ